MVSADVYGSSLMRSPSPQKLSEMITKGRKSMGFLWSETLNSDRECEQNREGDAGKRVDPSNVDGEERAGLHAS